MTHKLTGTERFDELISRIEIQCKSVGRPVGGLEELKHLYRAALQTAQPTDEDRQRELMILFLEIMGFIYVFDGKKHVITGRNLLMQHSILSCLIKRVGDHIEMLSQQPASDNRHKWDRDGERCVRCGEKDWMDSAVCDSRPASDLVEQMKAELLNCQHIFAHYADLHSTKNTPDGNAKAATNLEHANRIAKLLAMREATNGQ